MSIDYEAPDPAIAEFVHRCDVESEQQLKRLKDASVEELIRVVQDRGESTTARGTALLGLMSARAPEMNDLLLELFEEPDQDVWRMGITGARVSDPRIRDKLYKLLDDPDDANWSWAALMLARAGEDSLLSHFVAWLEEGDEGHRNVAVDCLKVLKGQSGVGALQDYWDRGKGDGEIRLVVAAALLDCGDQRGQALLNDVARHSDGGLSVFAATSIYAVHPREGLAHMLHILDNGNLESRQSMVNQIWNFARLPHAFTADGLAEARVWVESQRNGAAGSPASSD
jgi:hypothetical protein